MTVLLPAIPPCGILLGLIIVHTARGVPCFLLFMRAYFSTAPLEVKKAAGMGGCATTAIERLGLPPLQTVSEVDLSRYIDTWFEIASFPQGFQKGCTATTVTYTLRGDGEIDVLNRCRKGSLDGRESSPKGRARVVDATSNAKLQVTFFWPFWGDYWIIDLGEDYEYAVVRSSSPAIESR